MSLETLQQEQQIALRANNKKALVAFLLFFASIVLYPFLFAVIPDTGSLPLLLLLGWPITVIACVVHLVKTLPKAKHTGLEIQVSFIKSWLVDVLGYSVYTAVTKIDPALVLGEKPVLANLTVETGDGICGLLLFKDEVGDRKKVNFYWYSKRQLQQDISGITYLIAESDFTHRLFKQFETQTTLLEWGQFEDLLHVETTDETEARYLLPPDIMEEIYDNWSNHTNQLGRVKFADNTLSIVTGLKTRLSQDVNETLLHQAYPDHIKQSHSLLQSLEASIPLQTK